MSPTEPEDKHATQGGGGMKNQNGCTDEQMAALVKEVKDVMSDGQPRTTKELNVILTRKNVETTSAKIRDALLQIPEIKRSEFQKYTTLWVMEVSE